MPRIDELQSSRNAETQSGWACFASHRERVTQLLLDMAPVENGRLCVLGAGNCNDLALARLTQAYGHIDLVDIDEEAIQAGITRQEVASDAIAIQGGIDVTGVTHLMSAWTPEQPATDEQVDACISLASHRAPLLGEATFSVAASVCLLSQLIESVALTLGENHPRFLELLTCVRHEHLRQLVSLATPGGTVVLITDVVSSSTLPELATCSPTEVVALVGRAIADRNFFSGVNPFVIKQLLETDESLAPHLTDVRLSNPWVWDLGPRLYAVCAMTAKRV
ncbi:MAG TPA: hypothetical protein P5307_11265 [Pirellulaceae bacterium]|nr:hypothetical protein [Planctomycetales bacterium]MCA9171887.1 hypothetical protein [Planctomycetales bacterium]MCB9937966.1 hypothetical protein [Planctomycetaceae bacterium]HRX79633.1 hypothetical protein [Pirellulaceae bacterium]